MILKWSGYDLHIYLNYTRPKYWTFERIQLIQKTLGHSLTWNVTALSNAINCKVEPFYPVISVNASLKRYYLRQIQKQPRELFYKKGVLKGLRPATLLKKSLWDRCFSVNFVKFLRTHFLHNTSRRLLLQILRPRTTNNLIIPIMRLHTIDTLLQNWD